jgi:hypothetical protein
VPSLNRPGGNVTGVNNMSGELGAKQLGLLHELLPAATRFAVLVNPNNRFLAEPSIQDAQATASTLGLQAEILYAGTNRDIDSAFASLMQKRADGLMVGPDPLFNSRLVQLATLAVYHRVPAIYFDRAFAGLWITRRPLTDARLRADARGRDAGVARSWHRGGVNVAPRQKWLCASMTKRPRKNPG